MKLINLKTNLLWKLPLAFGLAAIVGLSLGRAQQATLFAEAGTSLSPVTNVLETVYANLPTIEATPLVSAASVPYLGNFFSAQCTNWPPLPGNILNLPVWDLGDGFYVLDDLDVDYVALEAKAAKLNGGRAAPMLLTSFTLPQGLLLTPPVFTNGNVSISIGGLDPSVPYDVYYTTNLSSPIQWALVAHGTVGQTNYVFANNFSGSPTVFFIAGSGADTLGQGLSDGFIALVLGLNPFASSPDGMTIGWKYLHGLNPYLTYTNYVPPATPLIITKPSNRAVIQ